MRVLVGPDKFKGTASAAAAAAAIAEAVESLGAEAVLQPMADGGEGTLEALGGPNRSLEVTGPLGQMVTAQWRMGPQHSAVVEMAEASGLQLVGGAEGNDAVAASTDGTGQLISAAIQRGAREVIVAVGGSATTDGGWGALNAMHPVERLRGIDLLVACDVRTRFTDAADVFGPQKGATPAQVEFLRRRLARLAQLYEGERGIDVTPLEHGGAAGGLAGGLASVGARLANGFDVVADAVDLYSQIETVDLVVTGEGRVDQSSLEGKVVGGVCDLAADAGVAVVVIAGVVDEGVGLACPARSLVEEVGLDRATGDTTRALAEVARDVLKPLLGG